MLALHMRMRHGAVDRRRMGIEGYDTIGGRPICLGAIKLDLKPSEVNAIKPDRLGRHAQLAFLQVDVNLIELLLQGDDLLAKL